MPVTLTTDDFRVSLAGHVQTRGEEIRQKHGPRIGWSELQRIVEDRACVRYPCRIQFDAHPLGPGEMAHALPLGNRPEDGFQIYVHPLLMTELGDAVYAVLYQLVPVNYGPFASAEDAEIFGAAVLGISQEEYYQALCSIADRLSEADPGELAAEHAEPDHVCNCAPAIAPPSCFS